ncbi:uncharacterized protein BO95DRAFT_453369 [Aspergillus brunneoviolaceus CBS 621.78]|uniref:Uncharacterized protein n=1 Tax=Aspergillus brunneoviolaceus CBS 621.78 TaxID=1450534 RepID=A0ACD1G8K8_9EURO|nr:hypothetical protein BO95DRAFT_453369 [Aspergillus brunneoviolaceus CBS 621.78]RAH45629.1 hypothetical protein BO95DRAFT_453369 [Aspergillus brunneoviolaceus CBS 621.78]
MRLFSIFLYFLCCATGGKAAKTAGIFETVFYYYAYRIEVSAFPNQEDRMIAWRCVPAAGTVCTFFEFVRAIMPATETIVDIDAANTILPPVEDADTTFADMRYEGRYEIANLYRGSTKTNHVDMVADITNRIQAAREEISVNSELLSNAKKGLKIAQAMRWTENLVKTQNAFAKRYPGVTLYETEEEMDGVTIKVIDWVKTAKVQASQSNSKSTVLQNRYKKWVDTNKGDAYNHHQDILRSLATCQNVLNAVPSCRAQLG